MARLVLEMREGGKGGKLKQRLELLAAEFLRITGQSGESGSIAPIQNLNRTQGRVTLTM
jgi:hypothetical protein